ncbi:MAG: sigma-70 family RNA polymerase sigma factor [Candidatus Eisenbacteria bacterium]
MQTLTSDELVSACLEHERGAWEEFLRRYANLIHSTILKVGVTGVEQEEAFQNSVIAMYRELPRLRDRGKILSWIVGISHRQGVNRIRARRREVLVEEVSDDMMTGDQTNGPGDDALPATDRLKLEQAQQTREAMDLLPERCRRLLEMLFIQDPPADYAEISKREKIPVGSIGPTRQRCLDKARKTFRDRGWV